MYTMVYGTMYTYWWYTKPSIEIYGLRTVCVYYGIRNHVCTMRVYTNHLYHGIRNHVLQVINGIQNHGVQHLVPLTMVYQTIHTKEWYSAFNGIRNHSYRTTVCAFDNVQSFSRRWAVSVYTIRLLASFGTHELKRNKCAEQRFRQRGGCACRVRNRRYERFGWSTLF